MNLNRRQLFAAAAAGALAGTGSAADLAKMIVRSSRPEDLEMPLAGFNQWITPVDQFLCAPTPTYRTLRNRKNGG